MQKLLEDMDLLRNSYAKKASHDFGNKKIMAIDDCAVTLNIINQFLRSSSNLSLELYKDERAALKSFMQENPDVVILDMNLGKLDGQTVALIMRNLSLFEVPIIFISADYEKQAEITKEYGERVTFLPKPLRKHSLISALEEICTPAAA
tara:strand:+ start:4816 stop:5262 length:447 start_codon:yes stop_codon:yes gene_type:complete